MSNPYKFYKSGDGRVIYCVTHYAGKAVRASAKCAPNDEFNEETGKTLAKLRCDVKVAHLRAKRAHEIWSRANLNFLLAESELTKREEYLWDSEESLNDAMCDLQEFTKNI